jgi:hypothetical protein
MRWSSSLESPPVPVLVVVDVDVAPTPPPVDELALSPPVPVDPLVLVVVAEESPHAAHPTMAAASGRVLRMLRMIDGSLGKCTEVSHYPSFEPAAVELRS